MAQTGRQTLAVAGREFRATIRLAGPLVAGQLCLIGGNVVDVVLAGHLGAHVLGAVAVGASIWSFALIGLSGLMMALPPIVSALDGAGRRHEAVPVFYHALVLALAAGLLAWAVIAWGGPMLVASLGLEPELARNVDAFLGPISCAAPALSVYFAARGLSEGLGVTWPTMAFGLAGLILLIPLGYVLMYGAFGLPGQGSTRQWLGKCRGLLGHGRQLLRLRPLSALLSGPRLASSPPPLPCRHAPPDPPARRADGRQHPDGGQHVLHRRTDDQRLGG